MGDDHLLGLLVLLLYLLDLGLGVGPLYSEDLLQSTPLLPVVHSAQHRLPPRLLLLLLLQRGQHLCILGLLQALQLSLPLVPLVVVTVVVAASHPTRLYGVG